MKRSQVCLKKKFFFINQKFAHNYFHNYLEIYDRTFSEIYFTYNYFQLKYPALSKIKRIDTLVPKVGNHRISG